MKVIATSSDRVRDYKRIFQTKRKEGKVGDDAKMTDVGEKRMNWKRGREEEE